MKIKELKQKSANELRHLLQENREKLRQFRFDLAGKKLKNVRQIREMRRDIARIMTLINTSEKGRVKNEKPKP